MSPKPLIGILALRNSNFNSVANTLNTIESNYCLVSDAHGFAKIEKLIIPGVGKIGAVMNEIDLRDFRNLILDFAKSGMPVLGICLGMQALGSVSTEDLKAKTLGLLPFETEKLEEYPSIRIPHAGWNSIEILKDESKLLWNIPNHTDFYFSHSFAVNKSDSASSSSTHGKKFVASVEFGSIYGVQFHPEKSQKYGKTVLTNFIEKC